jgi:hypothetical protein
MELGRKHFGTRQTSARQCIFHQPALFAPLATTRLSNLSEFTLIRVDSSRRSLTKREDPRFAVRPKIKNYQTNPFQIPPLMASTNDLRAFVRLQVPKTNPFSTRFWLYQPPTLNHQLSSTNSSLFQPLLPGRLPLSRRLASPPLRNGSSQIVPPSQNRARPNRCPSSALVPDRAESWCRGGRPNRAHLECGEMSPFSDWQTCLPVPKRGRARALQIEHPSASLRAAKRSATVSG